MNLEATFFFLLTLYVETAVDKGFLASSLLQSEEEINVERLTHMHFHILLTYVNLLLVLMDWNVTKNTTQNRHASFLLLFSMATIFFWLMRCNEGVLGWKINRVIVTPTGLPRRWAESNYWTLRASYHPAWGKSEPVGETQRKIVLGWQGPWVHARQTDW